MTTPARIVVGQRAENAPAPQPGPQTDALLATEVEELFYGGAAFGGKTEFLLLDFLQDVPTYGKAWRGVLFRKSYTDLEEIIERSRDMFAPTGAEYQAAPHWRWTWANGATLRFRYMESTKDMMRHQGQSYCVAVGTPIRMANGSFKTIELIDVGDLVATLEGPRRVTATLAPYRTPCVRARVFYRGDAVGEQIHPVSHPILSHAGWLAWSGDGQSGDTVCLPRLPASLQPLWSIVPAMLHAPTARSALVQPYRLLEESIEHPALDKSERLLSENTEAQIRELMDRLQPRGRGQSKQDPAIPLPSDAVEPHRGAHRDASGTTPTRNHPAQWSYRHPYSGEVRYPSEEVASGSLELSPCGAHDVCDITVEDANHYISACGLVNKNTWVGWDELTHWGTDKAYRYLRARLRANASLGIEVPTKRIRATANPGGPGHHWVKSRWVTPNPSGYQVRICEETKHRLLFIPAKIRDNPIGLRNDPNYANRLLGLGSPELVRAWLDGDWSIVEGAYFDCWSAAMVLRPVTLPGDWIRFRSCDWGSASPFAVHWWAVVQDDWRHLDGPILPRGALICYREWYGSMNPAEEGQRGLKLTAEELAEGIVRRERGEKLAYGVIDPSAFTEDGGPSKAERINNVLSSAHLVGFHAADNRRVPGVGKHDAPRGPIGGWDQLRARMKGTEGKPMIYTWDTCVAAIRTIPAIQHDPNRPEDVSSDGEDHCADCWRYAVMSRPWLLTRKPILTPLDGYKAANEDALRDRWMAI